MEVDRIHENEGVAKLRNRAQFRTYAALVGNRGIATKELDSGNGVFKQGIDLIVFPNARTSGRLRGR